MSYYTTCPDCGANLDPGEICDCGQKENGLPDANQISPRKGDPQADLKPSSTGSVPHRKKKVKRKTKNGSRES